MSQYLPNIQSSYTWFLYLGIAFFISHIFIYGFGLNLSYFGIILIYIGARKPILSNWFRNLLWFFIILDTYSTVTTIRDKITNRFVTFNKNLQEGIKKKSDDEDTEHNDDNNDNNE
jgi:hypothetical protein